MTDRRKPILLSADPQGILLLLCFIFGTTNSIVKVDVRCYCNLSVCAPTSYMCRSSEGVCVSERETGERWRWRHACIELLSRQVGCQENVTRHCCTEDMCNYFGSPPANRSSSHHHVTGYLSNHDTSLLRGGHSSDPRPWFRVTVVAVPVAGGLVLVVLIVMAVKMLRAESQRQTRLKPAEISHHVVYQRSRRQSFLPKSFSCVLPGSGQSTHMTVRSYASMGSLSRSASIALSTDSGCTDTSKEKYFVFDV